jgi:hypothetical protein
MTNLDPSILNAMRRRELDKDPKRNIIPAMRRGEEAPEEPEATTTAPLGKLATLASNIRLIAKP